MVDRGRPTPLLGRPFDAIPYHIEVPLEEASRSSTGGDEGTATVSIEEIEDAVLEGDSPIGPRRGTVGSAFRHRTFRVVFLGFFASNIGTWMQNVVLGAYAYDITRSSTFVGVVMFAQLGPTLVFPMLGGLMADKVDRRAFLILLSLEQLVFSLGVAWVVRSGSPSHLLLVIMVVMVGVGGAMFGPAYSAVLPMLVGREDLPGAISLYSAQMNGSRVIGPIIGGLLYPVTGPAWIFVINGATYLFVVAALFMITLPEVAPAATKASHWRELFAGIGVARRDRAVGRALVTVFLFSLLALAFIGQMPVVAAHNLGIPPDTARYGLLYACFGIGALVGAISIGTVFAHTSKPTIVRVCLLAYALSLTAFALLRVALAAFFVVTAVGAFYFAFITALNTALQARLDNAVRGRVMALWMMGFGGTVGVGNLIFGPVVAAIGITNVLLLGAGVALGLVWFADVRPARSRAAPSTLSLEAQA
jgi:MFS family permease